MTKVVSNKYLVHPIMTSVPQENLSSVSLLTLRSHLQALAY